MTNPDTVSGSGKKPRILVADDTDVNQKIAQLILQKAGYEVDVVENGQAAVEACRRHPYDLILMDIQMPIMDGYEATKRIRDPNSNVINHDTKIIALTAHAMKGDREKCIEAGMDDYLPKPINPNELHHILERYLST